MNLLVYIDFTVLWANLTGAGCPYEAKPRNTEKSPKRKSCNAFQSMEEIPFTDIKAYNLGGS